MGFIFLMLGGCVAPADKAPISPRPIFEAPHKLGIHLLLDDGRNHWPESLWPEHLRYARQAVGEWGFVTQVIRADDLDAAKWQTFMDLCAAYHLTPMLRLATVFPKEDGFWRAPERGPGELYRDIASQYAAFIAGLEWPTDQHFVIVGNEPNHGNEWGGVPDPAAYARFLMDVADTIHAADPQARVLNAGFDPYSPHSGGLPVADGFVYLDEETFLDQMAAAEPDVFRHIDAWASHAYPMGPFSEPPWVQTYSIDLINGAANPAHVEPPGGIYNRGINGYEWELWKLSTYGVEGLPVFITETGWRHAEAVDAASPDNGRPLPDAATVALYFDLALHGNGGRYPEYPSEGWTPWRDDPRVVAITPFALDGHPAEWSHTNWLMVDPSGAILGVYEPLDIFMQEIP